MSEFTITELDEAHKALLSTLKKCEKIDKDKLGQSQRTLLERRINALNIALLLIEKEREGEKMNSKNNERIYKTAFSAVYPLYVQKAERKGRTKEEVDKIICWLTGYDEKELQEQLDKAVTFEEFFNLAPQIHPNTVKITGVICGVRVENIEEPLMQKIRWLDKLIDELAKGRPMEKILRS